MGLLVYVKPLKMASSSWFSSDTGIMVSTTCHTTRQLTTATARVHTGSLVKVESKLLVSASLFTDGL